MSALPVPTIARVRAAWMAQFVFAGPSEKHDMEVAIDTFLAPLGPPEPAYPTACSNCGVGYDECTVMLRRPRGKCCCTTCHVTATHNQHAWEAWARTRRTDVTL